MKVIGLTTAHFEGLTKRQTKLLADWRARLMVGIWANPQELARDVPHVLSGEAENEMIFHLDRREGFGVVAAVYFPNQLVRCHRVGLLVGTTRAGSFPQESLATAQK